MDHDTRKPQVILDYNETKGGVDTVDKMCAAYSVSRITKRWPCVVFYTLMNIAQILYKFAYPEKDPKHRRFFLKKLSLTMMKRSNVKHLPQDITAFLKVNYGREVEPTTEEERIPLKCGACRSCAVEKKRSSASRKCCRSQSFTCKNHSAFEVVCNNCKKENIDSE